MRDVLSLKNILAFSLGALLFGSYFISRGFTEPTATPPLNNVAAPTTLPTGFLGFFNLASCPTGWTRYSAADGRYMVGRGSNIGSTVGSALSNLEDRAVGYHTHGVYDPTHTHGVSDPSHSHNISPTGGGSYPNPYNALYKQPPFWADSTQTGNAYTGISLTYSGTGISIYPAGSVSSTNAPYIQVLICQKN